MCVGLKILYRNPRRPGEGKQPYAVLSIGGFLGIGTRLVVVPYDLLKFANNKVILPGGTKEGLKMLPEFKYATG